MANACEDPSAEGGICRSGDQLVLSHVVREPHSVAERTLFDRTIDRREGSARELHALAGQISGARPLSSLRNVLGRQSGKGAVLERGIA
jgi:hypothetical protein